MRAELLAVLAVLAAVLSGTGGCICSDSEVIVSGPCKLKTHSWSLLLWRKHAYLDVWYSLYQALQRSPRPWRVIKVSRHKDWHNVPDACHPRLWYHNDAADAFAKEAHSNFCQRALTAHASAQRAMQIVCKALFIKCSSACRNAFAKPPLTEPDSLEHTCLMSCRNVKSWR